MWLRLSVTPAWRRKVSATKNRPFSSMQNATGLASSGSAANSSTFRPGARRIDFAAWAAFGRGRVDLGLVGFILGPDRARERMTGRRGRRRPPRRDFFGTS